MLRKLVTFQQAVDYLGRKRDLPTFMKTRQIAQLWSDETKRRAFFSARVASVDILSELHSRVSAVAEGRMSDRQARELLRRFLETDGAEELARLGFMPQPDAPDTVGQLASVRRLQLIVAQNVKMAQEVGHYRQWQENADMFPYGIWHLGVSEEHRAEHVKRDGLVFRFDHPVWTQDPPGGQFNCHCWREQITEDELRSRGLSPQSSGFSFQPTPLGFDPSQGIDQPVPVKPSTPGAIASSAASDILSGLATLNAALNAARTIDTLAGDGQ